MPSRRSGRGNRARRQPVHRIPPRIDQSAVENEAGNDAVVPAPISAPARPVQPARASTRTRSRAPAQIVIANYDFLRHDLRILGLIGPSLVVVLVILSLVIH